jgi:hypothetical protein
MATPGEVVQVEHLLHSRRVMAVFPFFILLFQYVVIVVAGGMVRAFIRGIGPA